MFQACLTLSMVTPRLSQRLPDSPCVFFLPPGRRNLRAQDLARSTAQWTNLFRFGPEVPQKAAALRQLTRVRVGGLWGPAGQTDPGKRLAERPTGWQAGAALAALTEQRQVHKGLGGQLGAAQVEGRGPVSALTGPTDFDTWAQERRDFKPDSGAGPLSQEGVQDYVVVFCPVITVWGNWGLSREKAPTNSPLQSGTHSDSQSRPLLT